MLLIKKWNGSGRGHFGNVDSHTYSREHIVSMWMQMKGRDRSIEEK